MLGKLPESLGRVLEGHRAGMEQVTLRKLLADRDLPHLHVTSSAFANGKRMPVAFTADGEGVSPPLEWRGMPAGSAGVALIVEDADSPTPHPLVHAIAVVPGGDGSLAAGALASPHHAESTVRTGRNSYLQHAWLPPDPPPGHGEHRYVFQLFPMSTLPQISPGLGRKELTAAILQHATAVGCLIGVYAREQRVKADEETESNAGTAGEPAEPGLVPG